MAPPRHHGRPALAADASGQWNLWTQASSYRSKNLTHKIFPGGSRGEDFDFSQKQFLPGTEKKILPRGEPTVCPHFRTSSCEHICVCILTCIYSSTSNTLYYVKTRAVRVLKRGQNRQSENMSEKQRFLATNEI